MSGVQAPRSTPATWLPLALAHLHLTTPVEAVTSVRLAAGLLEDLGRSGPITLEDVIEGAGFELLGPPAGHLRVRVRRRRTLADTVGPGMAVLVCGLNPSLHAADAGVGYCGPGNRFWPAARAAGLVGAGRTPLTALLDHDVGMTDLVKRASPGADGLAPPEYTHGLGRLERLTEWLRPNVVAMVGLAGWRAAVDRRAAPGWQTRLVGGRPVYVLPSTSGRNARTSFAELVDHLGNVRRAARTGGPDHSTSTQAR